MHEPPATRGGDLTESEEHVDWLESFGKVATLLRQHYGITVGRSGLVRAVDRAGRRAQPTYAALQQQLRRSPVVTPDGR